MCHERNMYRKVLLLVAKLSVNSNNNKWMYWRLHATSRDCFVLAIQDLQNFLTAVCFNNSKPVAVGLRGDPQSFYICEVSSLEIKVLYKKKKSKPHFFQCRISALLCLSFGSFIPRQSQRTRCALVPTPSPKVNVVPRFLFHRQKISF